MITVQYAKDIREALNPACHRTAIAGEVRRGDYSGNVLDVVIAPIIDELLFEFGEAASSEDQSALLTSALLSMKASGMIRRRIDLECTQVMDVYAGAEIGQKVRLIKATTGTFGSCCALAIGPQAFSDAASLSISKGGILAENRTVIRGGLYEYSDSYLARGARLAQAPGTGTLIPAETQEKFFCAIGIEYTEPRNRTEAWVSGVLRRFRIENGLEAEMVA